MLGHYQDVADPGKEYQRKLRTVIRGWTALARHPEVLNPAKFGLFAWQVFSHKLMRWAVPWFLVVLFVVSIMLAGSGWIYSLALVLQLAFTVSFWQHTSRPPYVPAAISEFRISSCR